MLRVVNFCRCQPAARSLLLTTNRYQQSSVTSGSSKPKTETSSSSSKPPHSPPPPTGGNAGTVKAIVYGLALGLGATLLYAEYENQSFRRKVESTIPLSSTVLNGLDKIIDPLFGRQKKLPDVSDVADKLPDKDQIKKAGEQAKDTINDAYDKLPEYKKVKDAVTHAADQVKDAVHTVRDALPDSKSIKKTFTHAKEQVEDAAKSVKDALPKPKGLSGEQSHRGNDPVFLEEPGEVVTKPPIKPKK